mmetsp:Transcript_35470/g.88495  ORF Transcript_35470/g.88495 Transcript_35470/m.88495 type:complete len:225 (-) Transcript_35470:53-727(-)
MLPGCARFSPERPGAHSWLHPASAPWGNPRLLPPAPAAGLPLPTRAAALLPGLREDRRRSSGFLGSRDPRHSKSCAPIEARLDPPAASAAVLTQKLLASACVRARCSFGVGAGLGRASSSACCSALRATCKASRRARSSAAWLYSRSVNAPPAPPLTPPRRGSPGDIVDVGEAFAVPGRCSSRALGASGSASGSQARAKAVTSGGAQGSPIASSAGGEWEGSAA